MNWDKNLRGFATICILCIISSCSVDQITKSESRLRIQVNSEIDILNPALSRLSVSTFVEGQMALPIAKWDEKSQDWVPVLVQNYEPRITGDGVQYPLCLRPEARWSDGTPITIQDLEYTIKMGLNPYLSHQSWAAYLSLITRLTPSHDTLLITLETPYILADEFIAGLSPYPAHILDSSDLLKNIPFDHFLNGNFSPEEDERLKELAEAFNTWGSPREWPDPVSGMYRLTNWNPGQEITLSRTPNFWGQEVNGISSFFTTDIDTLQFVIIPDPQNALHAFTSGAVDILSTVDEADTTLLSRFSGRVHEVPTLQLFYISVNNTHPVLSRTEIRRALHYAINRQDLVDRLFSGRGSPAYGPIHPSKPYYDGHPVPYNPEIARQILDSIGCADNDGDGILECPTPDGRAPLSFQIWTTRSQLSRNVATMLKGYWNSIGVELTIQSSDFRTFLPELQNKTYDFAALALRQNNLLDDPYPLWHSSQSDASGKNYQGLASDSIDVVLEQLRGALQPEKQFQYYEKFQEYFAEQVPVLFLVAPEEVVVVRDGIDLYWSPRRPGFDLLRSSLSQ